MICSKSLSGMSSTFCSLVKLVLKLSDDFKFVFPWCAILACCQPFPGGVFVSFSFPTETERYECEKANKPFVSQKLHFDVPQRNPEKSYSLSINQ